MERPSSHPNPPLPLPLSILSPDSPGLEDLPALPLSDPPEEGPEPHPAIRLRVEAAPILAHPGEALSLTVQVENVGTLPLAMLVLSGTVPAGAEGLHVPEGWAYEPAGRRLSYVLPALEVGAVYSATFSARVGGQAAA
ncbi:MAG: hypothetical protein ACP5NB_13655, partial [Chloroflexia bacterium]